MSKRIEILNWKSRKLRKLLFSGALLIIMFSLSLALAVPATAATNVVVENPGINQGYWSTITSGRYAQTFTTGPSSGQANTVQLPVTVWQGATFNVSITGTTASGLPDDAAVLASGSSFYNWYNSIGWVQISLGSGTTLAANTKYALVVTGTSATGNAQWSGTWSSGYTNGNMCVYSGSSWQANNEAPNGDYFFKVLNILPDYSLTVATNPAGIGSTTGSGMREAGATVSISAPHIAEYSGSAYHFDGWTGATAADSSSNETTMTMPASATTITANYTAQHNYESFEGPIYTAIGFDDWWHAQTFITASAYDVNAVSLYMSRSSSFLGTMTASIRAIDSIGRPTGPDLVYGTIDVNNIPINPVKGWVSIPMTGSYTLSDNTKYALQVRATGGPGYIYWYFGRGYYSGGEEWFAQLNGSLWQKLSDTDDFLFRLLGDPPLNVPPAAAASTITATEDTDYAFAPVNFKFSDADSDTLSDVEITTLLSAGKGTLKLSGVDVTAGQQIPAANIGNLIYRAPADQNGTAYTSFTFKVKAGPTWSESAAAMTINVNAVDDPPTATSNAITGTEDTDYTFAPTDFSFTDVENDSRTDVEITTIPAKGTLTLSGLEVAAGAQISVTDIPNLKYIAPLNDNGTGYTSFTFKVKAGGAWSASAATMTVNINAVDDPPIASNNTITAREDTSYTFAAANFTFTDVENNGFANVEITTVPDKGTLKLSGSNVAAGAQIAVASIPNLKYKAAANENGTGYTSFTFKVKAGGAWSTSAAIMTIDVTPVNDAPVIGTGTLISQTVEYSDAIVSGTITASDIDSPYSDLSVTGLPAGLTAEEVFYGGNGTLADPATRSWNISGILTGRSGAYLITVTDGTASTATGVTITANKEKALIRYDNRNPKSVDVADADTLNDSVFRVYVRQEADGSLGNQTISARNTSMQLIPVSGGNPIFLQLANEPSFANLAEGGEVELCFKTVDNSQVFGVDTYIVQAFVLGNTYYFGVGGEDLLAVFDPNAGTQGHGSFYWPGSTDQTDFAFTVQYNKTSKNLLGSFLIIRHLADGGGVYRIKSNSLYNLAQNGNKVSFAGKCTYIGPDSALDADGNPVNEGGKEFVVYAEDNNNPSLDSSPDKFWFMVFGKTFTLDSFFNKQADNDELISIPGTNSSGEVIIPYTTPGNGKN